MMERWRGREYCQMVCFELCMHLMEHIRAGNGISSDFIGCMSTIQFYCFSAVSLSTLFVRGAHIVRKREREMEMERGIWREEERERDRS